MRITFIHFKSSNIVLQKKKEHFTFKKNVELALIAQVDLQLELIFKSKMVVENKS